MIPTDLNICQIAVISVHRMGRSWTQQRNGWLAKQKVYMYVIQARFDHAGRAKVSNTTASAKAPARGAAPAQQPR